MVTITKDYLYLTALELSDIFQTLFLSAMPFNTQSYGGKCYHPISQMKRLRPRRGRNPHRREGSSELCGKEVMDEVTWQRTGSRRHGFWTGVAPNLLCDFGQISTLSVAPDASTVTWEGVEWLNLKLLSSAHTE